MRDLLTHEMEYVYGAGTKAPKAKKTKKAKKPHTATNGTASVGKNSNG